MYSNYIIFMRLCTSKINIPNVEFVCGSTEEGYIKSETFAHTNSGVCLFIFQCFQFSRLNEHPEGSTTDSQWDCFCLLIHTPRLVIFSSVLLIYIPYHEKNASSEIPISEKAEAQAQLTDRIDNLRRQTEARHKGEKRPQTNSPDHRNTRSRNNTEKEEVTKMRIYHTLEN